MFNQYDHISGAIMVRLHRYLQRLKNNADATLIRSNLFVGGTNSIELLEDVGINSVLDLRAENNDDRIKPKKKSINYLRIKILDRGAPLEIQVKEATDWIDLEIKKDRKVFVHCNLGRGRGPLMIVLFLITQGLKLNSAIDLVKKKRRFTFFNKKQINFLENFSKNCT